MKMANMIYGKIIVCNYKPYNKNYLYNKMIK